jgi:hypothetical protein
MENMNSKSEPKKTYKKNGWKYISLQGEPKDRGYEYGIFCADDFKEIQKMLKFFILETYGVEWLDLVEKIATDFKDLTKDEFTEFYEEMEGIVDGCIKGGCDTNIDEMIAWNFYFSISYWYSTISESRVGKEGGAKDRCSAFMAVGDWTADGKIVCAHNSFCDYIDGQYLNYIVDIKPTKGHRFIMQTSPCWIWSGSDFFVTSAGIIGTETTIGGFLPYEKKFPIGYRIRKAMQYGDTLDDYCKILLEGNSGDYANSWLFGDTNNNEILRIELGLKYHNIEKTKNGFFIGFNSVYDERIRNHEVDNSGFYDIRRHQGARLVRLSDLMDEHKGKINLEVAKAIISDHYDVYLKKDNPCSRTVCSHYDLDDRAFMSQPGRPKPFAPHGAVDGIVCDTTLAKKMGILCRFGNSCGTPFDNEKYGKEHRQYYKFIPYMKDRPKQPWTEFTSYQYKQKETSKGKKGRNSKERAKDKKKKTPIKIMDYHEEKNNTKTLKNKNKPRFKLSSFQKKQNKHSRKRHNIKSGQDNSTAIASLNSSDDSSNDSSSSIIDTKK